MQERKNFSRFGFVSFCFCLYFARLNAAQLREPSHVTSSDWVPEAYPQSFAVAFETNITEAVSRDYEYPVKGHLYYDWSGTRTQRVDHGAGSYECVNFYKADEGCSLYFNGQGMYRVLYGSLPKGQPSCCLDLPGVGIPPPHWARQASPTFNGITFDKYSGLLAYEWTFDHLQPPVRLSFTEKLRQKKASLMKNLYFHTMRQVAFGEWRGKPLLFSFPGRANGTQDYHYIMDTLEIGPQEKSLFEIPQGCANIACPQDDFNAAQAFL